MPKSRCFNVVKYYFNRAVWPNVVQKINFANFFLTTIPVFRGGFGRLTFVRSEGAHYDIGQKHFVVWDKGDPGVIPMDPK